MRIRAVIWLHIIRFWRYKYSFMSMVVSNAMWILLLILGVLLFVPEGELVYALRSSYWTIACWSVISGFSSLVGGWTNFFISLGMVEEHLLSGVSPFFVIGGRMIIAMIISIVTLAFMGVLTQSIFSVDILSSGNPHLMALSFTIVALESLAYSLTVSALAMRMNVSEHFLELINFAVVGLLIIPLKSLPERARLFYLTIPYVAPTYMLKCSIGAEDPSLFHLALAISLLETVLLWLISLLAMRMTEKYIMENCVRAIGFY
ncbi:MAG: hypothetical protein NZ992_04600 [Candidatus Korarchaeum sp.]|nr:hypothetical protein [Candidatus Korarchaeum sp.]MDW8035086.1 hypothetical protein [Candidatus Korarchaeum sp.]